jgi:hypothetical protein
MSSIASISRACGTNVGGLRRIQLVDVAEVVSIPDHINYVVASTISLKSGVFVAEIGFPTAGGDFTETPKDGDSGTVITSKFKIDLPKDAVELGQWVNGNKDKEVIALYQDENGVGVIVGDLERPLTLKVSRSSGRRGGDKNFYELSIEGISDHNAYYYNALFRGVVTLSKRVYSGDYTFDYKRTN